MISSDRIRAGGLRPQDSGRTDGGPHQRWIFVALLSAALWAPGSGVQADAITYFSVGYGRMPCSTYLDAAHGLKPNEKREMRSERVFVSENAEYDHWILGFLTAMNYRSAIDGGTHPDIAATNVEILTSVQQWCGQNPSRPVLDGVIAFINERWAATDTKDKNAPPSGGVWAGPPTSVIKVAFQPGVASADVAALLQAYHATIVEGPASDGFYKIKLDAMLSLDQLQTFIESMKSQVRVVKDAMRD